MKKRIKISVFVDENGDDIVIGGSHNIKEFEKNFMHPPYKSFLSVIDVPGFILGTPEDWDIEFKSRCKESYLTRKGSQ